VTLLMRAFRYKYDGSIGELIKVHDELLRNC